MAMVRQRRLFQHLSNLRVQREKVEKITATIFERVEHKIQRIECRINYRVFSRFQLVKPFSLFVIRFDFLEILRFHLESTRSRFDSQTTIKPFLPSSTIKVERQLTNINSINRLPTLYSLFDPDDQKRIANLRRRQVRTIRFNLNFSFDIFVSFFKIYALNHLMRELEQEQFHQYCQSNNIGAQTNSNPLTDESQSTGPTST